MAPKNNAKGGDKKAPAKGKAKDASASDDKGKGKGGLKAATSINVRHILVGFAPLTLASSSRSGW